MTDQKQLIVTALLVQLAELSRRLNRRWLTTGLIIKGIGDGKQPALSDAMQEFLGLNDYLEVLEDDGEIGRDTLKEALLGISGIAAGCLVLRAKLADSVYPFWEVDDTTYTGPLSGARYQLCVHLADESGSGDVPNWIQQNNEHRDGLWAVLCSDCCRYAQSGHSVDVRSELHVLKSPAEIGNPSRPSLRCVRDSGAVG